MTLSCAVRIEGAASIMEVTDTDTDTDTVLARAMVVPYGHRKFRGPPPDGPTKRVHRFWVHPSRRNDDEFAAALYPLMIAKAVELGWATDDDIVDYEMTDRGVRVGKVLIDTPKPEHKKASLRFRTVARGVAEDKAKAKNREVTTVLSDDVAEIKRLAEETKGEEKGKKP